MIATATYCGTANLFQDGVFTPSPANFSNLPSVAYGDDQLLTCETTTYDSVGQVIATTKYLVDPDTGYLILDSGTPQTLVDQTWYDPAGNVIEIRRAGRMSLPSTCTTIWAR